MREELLELGVELRGQGLVGRQHKRGPLHLLHNPGHGGRLARSGDAQQGLLGYPLAQAPAQLRDGLGLIARGV